MMSSKQENAPEAQKADITYEMSLNLNVLNHLGLNLYSNIPAVLSETVANSWDADATEVKIRINQTYKTIEISDNGHGMTSEDINNKFLMVGYQKRESGEEITNEHGRAVMGRKGIGKLSLFSIAKTIKVISKTESGDACGLELDVEKIKQEISSKNSTYHPCGLEQAEINRLADFPKGTKIILSNLKKNLLNTTAFLKRRLARRFSVLGSSYDFKVFINDEEVTVADRDYLNKVEYLWTYGDKYKDYTNKSNIEKSEERLFSVEYTQEDNDKVNADVSGWIGLVENSNSLQEGDDNLNKISILVRGKLAQEDILDGFREGGLYTKYLIGEIDADFLDTNDREDIATSSRQSIIEDDPRYIALKDFIQKELKHIEKSRAKFKEETGTNAALTIPIIKKWFDGLKGDTKNKAKSLFGKINSMTVDEQSRRQLYKHGILAFETMMHKDSLDSFDELKPEDINMLVQVFKDYDDIEASLYYTITSGRTKIIERLKEFVDANQKEKVLQEYLFDHLWLLDPSWDRATETPLMEQRVTEEFDVISKALSPDEQRGRVDIKYRKTTGKHIIIELKRASVQIASTTLLTQTTKYINALQKQLKEIGRNEPIEAVCVIGQLPKDWSDSDIKEREMKMMAGGNTRIITYDSLIDGAYLAYQEYMKANSGKSKILDIIKELS